MDFRTLGPVELASKIRNREVSAREAVNHSLERIDTQSGLGAFVAVDGDRALAEADAVDAAAARGDELGAFAGVPIGVKDMEDAAGFVTTMGSVLHRDDPPATEDSLLVERLRAAGCIVVGKTNTPEYAWKGDTHNTLFGGTANPWNTGYSAGGSSGGSAAAVAGGLVPLATASDGGGSIRIPAALCGLPGLKPSMARVPVGGPEPPGWPELSVKGILANTVADTVAVLDTVVGPDPSDRQSLPIPERSWVDAMDDLRLPRQVVWSPNLGYADVDDEVAAACAAAVASIAAAGVDVIQVDDLFDEDPIGSFLVLSGVGNLRSLRGYRDHPDWDQVDPVLRDVMGFAESLSAVDYLEHCDMGHRLNLRMIDTLHQGRVLLTPTIAGLPGPPGGVGTINGESNDNWLQMTYPFNMTRSPAGTIPVGLDSRGVPIGLQIVGPQRGDMVVLRTMAVLSELLDFDATPPI
ncbi:MAG TPA: amidase family protein [Acidimicrobiales bacterium]|nr:amidase family protein [Acidimicrobiales bacterium]